MLENTFARFTRGVARVWRRFAAHKPDFWPDASLGPYAQFVRRQRVSCSLFLHKKYIIFVVPDRRLDRVYSGLPEPPQIRGMEKGRSSCWVDLFVMRLVHGIERLVEEVFGGLANV